MDTLIRDLRYGFRSLLKRPGFTAIALVALALGIGANTAIFSLVNAVVLQPLPYSDPDRLVWVWGNIRDRGNRASVAPQDFLDFRAQNKTFEQFAASFSGPVPVNMTGNGDPERLSASAVTGNFFETFGVTPALGRGFSLDNERPGNDQVVILSHALWQKRFAGNPQILNRRITLDGKSFEVIGVMPKDVVFPQAAELWVPINFEAAPEMKSRRAHFLRPLGRLKPGVTLAQAQADTDVIAAQLEQQFPDSNTGWSLRLESLHERLVGSSRTTLYILLGAVGFVLLIACTNVANLLLVRATARQKEIALRSALGASRGQVARLLVTESLLLALLGGVLGALLAAWGIDLLVTLSETSIPATAKVKIDATVLAFTLLISLLTGLLFGIAPALRTMKLNLTDALKDGGRISGEGSLRNRMRSGLVVFESAVAVVLLIGAGLLVRSFIALESTNPGFEASNVLTVRVDLARAKYNTLEKASGFFQELETRIGAMPGVETVGMVTELPLSGQLNDTPFTVEGRPSVATNEEFNADWRRVNQNYFQAMRIPLLRGRNFTEQEVRQGDKVLVVSQQLVDTVFPNEEPLGKRLLTVVDDKPYEIIGVVGDIHHRSLEFQPYAALYMPTRQTGGMSVVIRTESDPLSLVPAIREQVKAIDPDQPIAAIRTMDEWIDSSVAGPRYRTTLFGMFAVLAMILAATGIYGVMSYSVAQRTHEIGVRMALGARRFDVLRLVVRQGMMLVLIGLGVGLAGAFALTRVMSSLLFGVTAKDPLTFVAVAGLLSVVALLACYIPARRATKVEPLEALRYE
ncbi:MAG TPA: ABC transporter permease [Pyrinomonadaceae bacterium]|nr:ABC transporter permease [Pyrinomonadaceae bacterium]